MIYCRKCSEVYCSDCHQNKCPHKKQQKNHVRSHKKQKDRPLWPERKDTIIILAKMKFPLPVPIMSTKGGGSRTTCMEQGDV